MTALLLAVLLTIAGIGLFVWDRTGLFVSLPCRPDDLTCPIPWMGPAAEAGCFVWAVGGVVLDGVRGRPCSRWLVAALALLLVELVVALVGRGVL